MYYIINITENPEDTHTCIGKVHMFPILCRVDDIISGHLTLEDNCVEHCSDKYDILFGTHVGDMDHVIEDCVIDIVYAHPNVPVIGVFFDGKYNKLCTIEANRIAENLHFDVEPLFDECKI